MKKLRVLSFTGFIVYFLTFFAWPLKTYATNPPALAVPSGLSFAEIKITGNEFLMLVNNTGSTINDLSTYWLYNFNNVNPLASGVSSSSQQLPTASLQAGQSVLLSSSGGQTCGAAVTARLSLSLTDSGGFLEVVKQSLVSGSLVQTAGDNLSWTSSSTGGVINSIPSSSSDPNNAYYRYLSLSPNTYSWQKADVDTVNACQMDVVSVAADTSSGINLLSTGSSPPAIILSSASSGGIPADDYGLSAPQLSELLPNPAGVGNDDSDEFVEIYNPNDVSFNLSGFTIESGLTTKHDYTFPDGSSIPAKTFAAFYASDTNLTLSNSGGEVWLLDPNGNILSQTDAYANAKDGQAWALANGSWYWTVVPTPNAANKISAPSSAGSSKTKTTPIVAGSSTNNGSSNSQGSQSSSSVGSASQPAPIHAWTLAGIGGAALLYAGYEYRTDLQNNIYRLRRYAQSRRAASK